jgi:hypothetical protein
MSQASVRASNKAYLQKIKNKLMEAPRDFAKTVTLQVYLDMVDISANQSGIDSGQALAHWKIDAYTGKPVYEAASIMWGYNKDGNKIEATAPVGDKYSGGQNSGALSSIMIDRGLQFFYQGLGNFTGIVVYNPASNGFADFQPGPDRGYVNNTFSENQQQMATVVASAIAKAAVSVKARLYAK